MKKKSIALLATITLVSIMTACSNNTDVTANPNESEPVVESQVTEPTETPVQESTAPPVSVNNDTEAKMAAFNAMTDKLNADSDQMKWDLFDRIMMYCILTNSEGLSSEDALNQLSHEDADFSKAFVAFINDNSAEIQEGYIAENQVWYTEDFDGLFNKFLSYQQTATTTVDTIGKALTNISMTDNTIFNENGVTLTYDYYDVETQKMFFTLENNNDSNKKTFLHIEGIYINGIGIMDSYHNNRLFISDAVGNAEDGIENGNTVQLEYYIGELVQLDKLYTRLDTNYTESPFETVQFDYRLQIGSNSDFVYGSSLMQTTLYTNDSFSSLFGEQLTTLEVANASGSNTSVLKTYGNFTDTKWIFAIKSETFENLNVSLNHVWVNGAELDMNADYTIYNLPNGRLYIMNYSEDELRKKCEIGNDEPLNVSVDINYVQQILFTK